MHHTRIAAFLLGAWLLGSVFMTFVATQNFETVNRVLKSPTLEANKMILALGSNNARQLLRYLVGEENRFFFENWELAQLILVASLTGLLLFGVKSRMLAGFAGAMLILTLFQRIKVTPELAWLGRSIDFLPWTAESLARDQFWRLHTAYAVIEVAKLLLGVAIGGFLLTGRRRRSRRRVEVDAVDYAHHRHVDR
jgi:hypothetical protein